MAAEPPPQYYKGQEPGYQSGYPPPQPQVVQTTVITQPVVVQQFYPVFRDYPVTITDNKGQQVQTVLEYRNGVMMWIVVGAICLFTAGFALCCLAIIPFFIKDLKDVYHINPTDGNIVGVYRRLS